MDEQIEKVILEKLNDIAKILFISHQKIENMQKVLIANLKKEGRLPGLENRGEHKGLNRFP